MADIMSSAVDARITTIPAARDMMAEVNLYPPRHNSKGDEIALQVISVAYKSGVRAHSLDAAIDFIIDDALEQYGDAGGLQAPKSNFKPSMLVDLEAGRPIELEAIVGNVVRAGRRLGVATPRCVIPVPLFRV